MISVTATRDGSDNSKPSSLESSDPLQLQQETILEIHYQSEKKTRQNVYAAEYVDSLLAKEFNSLTVQERSKTYEELHGVIDCVNETPAFVESCLLQLDEELSRISDKPAYDMAEQQNRAYVTDPKFRLRFLRVASFNPRKAAIRLVAFLEGKLRFFGRETLTRRFRPSDLSKDDIACLRSGPTQVLPVRDRSDRPVVMDVGSLQDQSFKIPANRLRPVVYLYSELAEDEETQK